MKTPHTPGADARLAAIESETGTIMRLFRLMLLSFEDAADSDMRAEVVDLRRRVGCEADTITTTSYPTRKGRVWP